MTSSVGSRPTTVIRATTTRLATAVLTAALAGAAPMQGLPGQSPQNAAGKPSAALPATAPTSSPTQNSPQASSIPAQHMDVQFVDGKVSVDASNASLNQVLHEVATKAGIKITGSVSEERVFGRYGPSPPTVVLAALLDGTSAYMLLVDDPNGASELILTPRRGSPTPPNPNAAQEANNEDSEPTSRYIPPIRPYQPPAPGRGPLSQGPNPVQQQPEANQPAGQPGTAQQIYDQLQKNGQQTTAQPQ
jgi:hypothetical protein